MEAKLIPTRLFAEQQTGAIGYGAGNLTMKPSQTPDEKAFEIFKLSIDSGSTLIDSAEFYGQPKWTLGLELLARFFEAEPSYKDRVLLTVKGATLLEPSLRPDASSEYLRKSVENINALLKHRKMDVFLPARVDPSRPIEDVMRDLVKLRDEGHFKYIGLSECSADTIRRAAKIAPIHCVEVEYSLWTLDIERNGVLEACKELKIPINAYSPLGRGFLTGQLKSPDDIPEGDFRRNLDRFKPENFAKNLKFVELIKAFAEKKGITPAQVCLSWLLAQWEGIIPIPGSTRLEGLKEALDAASVQLSPEEIQALRAMSESAEVVGGRYNATLEDTLAL